MLLTYLYILLAQFSMISVPESIESKFQAQYADVDVDFVNWEKKWGKYIAKFVNDDQVKVTAYFSEGKWLYSKEEVFFNAVEESIMDAYLNSKYGNSKLIEIAILKMPKGKTYYEFEVELFDFKKHIYFDAQGSIVDLKLK